MLKGITLGRNNAKGAVIMLHGLGDSGAGWAFIAQHFEKVFDLKWILPNAPAIPVTLNYGMKMPAWYDIVELSQKGRTDVEGIEKSVKSVQALIDMEVKNGMPANKIIVGGFSQGGAIAYLSGLRYKDRLGGIIGLSTYLPFHDEIKENDIKHKDTPIFIAHGEEDAVVSYQWGVKSSKKLTSLGCKVTFKSYQDLGHSASPAELDDIETFLEKECNVPRNK